MLVMGCRDVYVYITNSALTRTARPFGNIVDKSKMKNNSLIRRLHPQRQPESFVDIRIHQFTATQK